MQAIRTLRGAAHARAASPALDQFVEEPASHQKSISTNNTLNTNATHNHNYSTTFSRIQTFAKFRRPSPPTTPAPTPTPPPTLVQDGSYLQTLGLKLGEATSRALAPVLGGGGDSLKGRRPLPPGRGRALGALISSELTAARENPNLERAILRLLARSLSVLVTTLTAQLPPLLASPHYVPSSCTLPPAQWDASTQHGLALAGFCSELLEVFAAHSLGEVRSSDLGAIRATIENTVLRLTSPLFTALQSELVGCLEGATKPAVYRPAGRPHPALQQFQLLAPHAGRVLRRYAVDGGGACKATESQLASVLIAVSWAGMLALVCRPTSIKLLPSPSSPGSPPPGSASPGKSPSLALPGAKPSRTPPGTPKIPLRLLKDKDKDHATGSSPTAFSLVALPVVALTPVSGSGTASSSRPPSPPPPVEAPPLVLDFRVFLDVLERELPRPPAKEGLAGEAVDEAFARVCALGSWIARGFGNATSTLRDFLNEDNDNHNHNHNHNADDDDDDDDELPFLLALELVLRHRLGVESGAAAFLEMDEELYKKRCLSGFGRADEWACVVGRAVRDGLVRTHAHAHAHALREDVDAGGEDKKQVVRAWIKARVED